MKIEAPEENKIVVRLTADDMTKLHITYEEMDYANIETRRVIWTLLDEARRELGRDIDPSGRMLIEALPAREGGCVLQFTVLEQEHKPQRHLTMKKSRTPIVYEFTSAQRLLDAAENVRRLNALPSRKRIIPAGALLPPDRFIRGVIRPAGNCAFRIWSPLRTGRTPRRLYPRALAEHMQKQCAGANQRGHLITALPAPL